jgi:5'-AMP-activated protein kinase, catalytic alpha subunit
LLDTENNIKLADFGLSNVAHDGDFLRTSCGSPNYAAPEVISGNLYAGPEVDVWSCGVILYALLCGTLPFDDESIPNLFKKIKSGMYSLPSHLSQSSRDLILRMLVVDPMKRITIAEVRQHPWFQHKLPAYLSLPPDMIEVQHRYIDDDIVEKVCQLPIKDVNESAVRAAVLGHNMASQSNMALNSLMKRPVHVPTRYENDLRVAYELLLDAKRHKLRIADVVLALQDSSRTPPSGTTPKVLGLGVSPSPTLRLPDGTFGGPNSTRSSHPTNPAADVPSRRRRWYLGIQSKKDPAHVMNEVFKAMKSLNCLWYNVHNYRVLCLWQYTSGATPSGSNQLSGEMSHYRSPYIAQSDNMPIVYMDGVDHDGDADDRGDPMVISAAPSHQDLHSLNLHNHNHVHTAQLEKIKIAMSLYKVQQNIYLLDFQRVEGDIFSFMKLCSLIITELKNLSNASRNAAVVASGNSNPNVPVPSIPPPQLRSPQMLPQPTHQQQMYRPPGPPMPPQQIYGHPHGNVMPHPQYDARAQGYPGQAYPGQGIPMPPGVSMTGHNGNPPAGYPMPPGRY